MVRISEAEFEVMQIVWDMGQTTSFDIIERVKDKNWTNNTVRTLIKRLYKKGAIKIVKKQGKTFTYAPAIKKNDYQITQASNFLDKIFKGNVDDMLLNFVKQEKITKQDLYLFYKCNYYFNSFIIIRYNNTYFK